MNEFDEDIQSDVDNGNCYALALVAQDLRNLLVHVNWRALSAANRRKRKAEKKELRNERARTDIDD